MLKTSFENKASANGENGVSIIPTDTTNTNYGEALNAKESYWNSLGISIALTIATVILQVVITSLAGFALANYRGKSRTATVLAYFVI